MAQGQGWAPNDTDPKPREKGTREHKAENTFDFNLFVKITKHATYLFFGVFFSPVFLIIFGHKRET